MKSTIIPGPVPDNMAAELMEMNAFYFGRGAFCQFASAAVLSFLIQRLWCRFFRPVISPNLIFQKAFNKLRIPYEYCTGFAGTRLKPVPGGVKQNRGED